MIGAIARLAVRLGLPERLARIAAIAMVILVAIALIAVGKRLYDHALIARHAVADAATQARDDRAADADSATQRRADDARLATEAAALERITDNAIIAADALAARRAYYDCVRLQQQSRTRGDLTPACR